MDVAETGRTRGRRLTVVAAALAVLLVAGLAGWIVRTSQHVSHRAALADPPRGCIGDAEALPEQPLFGPDGTLSCSDDPHFLAALSDVEHALTTVQELPHSTPVADPPTAHLSGPSMVPMDGGLIDRAAFWTAPGTATDALAYLKAHPPTGMSSGGTGTDTGPTYSLETLMFSSGGRDEPSLNITVEAYAGGVAVRADAMGFWTPTKQPSDLIGQVYSVDITLGTLSGADVPMVQRTVTGEAAQRLADAIDALPLATPIIQSCPGRSYLDRLTFHTSGRVIQVDNRDCGGVTIYASHPVALAGNVHAEIAAALGLPLGYGT